MSLHQIIYTSCRRGIDGINDGQQVYSYDAAFEEIKNEEVKSLFSYQPPRLDAGVIMTEEIASTMPKSFIYRKLEDGNCTLTLNTYLGRDYMGSAGRFGNHLSHVVLADKEDIRNYPCEFYGSELLRDSMEFEEVNNPNRPDFLPKPKLERGFQIDIDAVIEFLSMGERLEIYKDMLYGVLAFESQRKRLVICDTPENIILWIAAIEYALPLKMALEINFSTYDYDPSLSASQICGVSPKGTMYNEESQRFHFVFDFYKKIYTTFEKDDAFLDFIDTAMIFSYESLQEFHRFLCEGYTYDKADEKMYAGYSLYSLLSDGIVGVAEKDIKHALNFAREYALESQEIDILQNLLGQKGNLLRVDSSTFLCIMNYMVERNKLSIQNYNEEIKEIFMDRVLYEFVNANGGEDSFLSFYENADCMCQNYGFSISTELMQKNNREKLFMTMQNDSSAWKIAFIVKVVSSYVKERNIAVNELMPDTYLGQTYYGLLRTVYSKNVQNGFYLVTRILDEFASDANYLVNMTLNIEGMLLEFAYGKQEVDSLWQYFEQLMLKIQHSEWKIVYDILKDIQRYEQIHQLYCLAMNQGQSVSEYQKIFREHYMNFVLKTSVYAKKYKEQIVSDYYKKLLSVEKQEAYDAKIELFYMLFEEKAEVSFVEQLVKDIVEPIPFKSPSKENSELIQNAFEYLYNVLHKPVKEKLLLLVMALVFEKCKKTSELHDVYESLKILTEKEKADLSKINRSTAETYFAWFLPVVCELCKCKKDIENLYALFKMPEDITKLFLISCMKIYLKQGKEEKEYRMLGEFLGVVFSYGNNSIREEIGKILCKLNKQKRTEVDDLVLQMYGNDKKAIRYWEEIKEVAENTNPILNHISNFLKRKKK